MFSIAIFISKCLFTLIFFFFLQFQIPDCLMTRSNTTQSKINTCGIIFHRKFYSNLNQSNFSKYLIKFLPYANLCLLIWGVCVHLVGIARERKIAMHIFVTKVFKYIFKKRGGGEVTFKVYVLVVIACLELVVSVCRELYFPCVEFGRTDLIFKQSPIEFPLKIYMKRDVEM